MSNRIIPQRMTATMEDEFCVFLIGMRINRPLKVHKWFPVFRAMPRMLRELGAQRELGYLNGHLWLGRTILMLQYWRSAQHLEAYARNKSRQHAPAWPGARLRGRWVTVAMLASGTKPIRSRLAHTNAFITTCRRLAWER